MNRKYVIKSFSTDIEQATDIISEEVKLPTANQVLIRNEYVGINALYDRELYRGAVPYINVSFPYVFGVEATGRVVEVGSNVTTFKKGDTVGTVKVGTAYQEYQVAAEYDVIPFPDCSPEHLTISPTGVSADLALNEVAELKGGETVVVSAAAGGLGHIVVQLCKSKGCNVVAICGTEQKVKMLESIGACDRIINHRKEDIRAILDNEYRGKINVGIDSVGRHIFDAMLANVAELGKVVIVGLASELSDVSFEKKMMHRVYESIYWKGASVRCFMNHLYKDKHDASRTRLFGMYADGTLQVKVDPAKFEGIASIKEASKYLLAGKSCGKVIVKI